MTTSRSSELRVQHSPQYALLTPEQRAIRISRQAERQRFGLPVWQLLAGGLVGVCAIARWYWQHWPQAGWSPHPRAFLHLPPFSLVHEPAHVEALLSDVRVVLERHGISLGRVPLKVHKHTETHVHVHMHTHMHMHTCMHACMHA